MCLLSEQVEAGLEGSLAGDRVSFADDSLDTSWMRQSSNRYEEKKHKDGNRDGTSSQLKPNGNQALIPQHSSSKRAEANCAFLTIDVRDCSIRSLSGREGCATTVILVRNHI